MGQTIAVCGLPGCAAAADLCCELLAVARKPVLVVILADDLGYGEMGCFGSPDVPTPNIDSIAARGVRFTDGYVTACICSPSPAAFMTGRYQQRHGHEFNPDPPIEREMERHLGLALSEFTLAQLLKKAGYATAAVGKWRLWNARLIAPRWEPQGSSDLPIDGEHIVWQY